MFAGATTGGQLFAGATAGGGLFKEMVVWGLRRVVIYFLKI